MSEEEKKAIYRLNFHKENAGLCLNGGTTCIVNIKDIQTVLKLIKKQQEELEKKDKVIDEMLQEFTDCEFELKCSNCYLECEKDYDQLYECNKQYFEKKVEE